MDLSKQDSYMKGFLPYALAAFLVGIVGGLSTVLGPAFVQDMGLPYNNTTWTALAQAISTAAGAPILGKLGDRFGRRNTLLLGILVFALGNVLSAIASSLLFFLIARFVVGIGMAAIAPTVLSYIVTEFPATQVAKGFSLYMLLSSVAVIFGPTIGSLILQVSNWRMLMWVSTILCILFFLLCFFNHPKQKFVTKPLQDFEHDGSTFTIGAFMARKAFILSVIILFLTQGLMQANMTNTIVFVNYTQPDNTAISGYAISIMYLGMSLGSILLGPLADRFEPKQVLTGSLLLTGIGCGIMLLFSESTSFFILAASLGVLGLGLGANATIFMKIVLSDLPPETAGTGTGTYGLFRDLAAPFGVAIFVPLFTNEVTRLAAGNTQVFSAAAVRAIHMLSMIELGCVLLSIVIVQFLPQIHRK